MFALSVIGVVLPEAGFLAFPLVLVWLIATSVLLFASIAWPPDASVREMP